MTGFTDAERALLLSAREGGGSLVDGYVAAGFFEDDMAGLRQAGLFDGDKLTEAGATVAAGLNWEG